MQHRVQQVLKRLCIGLWMITAGCLPAAAWAEAVGDANGLLKPVTLEEMDKVFREKLKSQVQVYDYRPQPPTPRGRPRRAPRAQMRPAVAAPRPQVSTTNLQEQGVDEADLVKTDGRYVYAVHAQAGVRVFDTRSNGKGLQQVAALGFGKGVEVNGIYLLAAQKQLLVIGSSYDYGQYSRRRGHYQSNNAHTHVITVDISTATKPRIIRQLKLDGYQRQTRRINNRLYLVMNHDLYGGYPELHKSVETPKPITDAQREGLMRPMLKAIDQWSMRSALPKYVEVGKPGSKPLINEQAIYLDNSVEMPYQLVSLLAFDLDAPDTRFESALYTGSVDVLYVSDKAMYLTSNYYSGITGLNPALPVSSMSSQLIHKFAFRGKGFDYRGSGLVLGQLGWNELSAFQMDEDSKGNLRVVSFNWSRTPSHRDPAARSPVVVTALAEHPKNRQLVTLSRLPNAQSPKPLGKPNEQLYGARLFNDYAYFVTFRSTDPLYVVDLRNPRQLKVAGELVIPGFSDYLHPVTDRLLLGIGKAAEASTGRATGWKLSLFDIGNPARPLEVAKVQIGSAGSDSPANRNHHAVTSLAVNGNRLTRVALPVSVANEIGGVKTGLHQFEVDHRTRTLTQVGAFHPPVMSSNGWYWNETDRSILIDQRLYYYRDGNFYVTDWAKTN